MTWEGIQITLYFVFMFFFMTSLLWLPDFFKDPRHFWSDFIKIFPIWYAHLDSTDDYIWSREKARLMANRKAQAEEARIQEDRIRREEERRKQAEAEQEQRVREKQAPIEAAGRFYVEHAEFLRDRYPPALFEAFLRVDMRPGLDTQDHCVA